MIGVTNSRFTVRIRLQWSGKQYRPQGTVGQVAQTAWKRLFLPRFVKQHNKIVKGLYFLEI